MQTLRRLAACLAFLLSTVIALAADAGAQVKNVIFILADDLGWSDTQICGKSRFYQTPNINRLAKRGVVFTNAYAASPLCSPTRASILLGQTPTRNGHTAPQHHTPTVRMEASVGNSSAPNRKSIETASVTRLDTSQPTLGKQLHQAGIHTGHFGKWHLGPDPYSPLQHGFEVDIPHWHGPGPAGNFVAPWNFPHLKANKPNEHIEDRMAEEAVKWMESVHEAPFYMQYWQFSVHAPFDAKEELIEKYIPLVKEDSDQKSPTYAAMVHSLDDAVGSLLNEVDRLGIADETAIIFFSDNGGNMYNGIREKDGQGNEYITAPTSNSPLRGGKATIYEGGVRVPCIVVWPGVTQAGTQCDIPIQSTDIYPTVHHMLGVDLPENHPIDGVDITPALRGDKDFDRGPIFNYFPHSPPVPDWLPPSLSVRDGDWKLIRIFYEGEDGKHAYRLYNLKEDIGERHNLAEARPEKVQELDALIEAHIEEVNAVVPLPNPDFDPAKYNPDGIGVQPGGLRVGQSRAQRVAHILGSRNAKPAEPVKGQRELKGWRAARETMGLREEEGVLVVHNVGNDPHFICPLEEPLEEGAPFTVVFETWTDAGGPGMRVYGSNKPGPLFEPSQKVDVPAPALKKWTPIRAELITDPPLLGVRINAPHQPGESKFRNIRLLDKDGKVVKNWF